MNHLVGRAKSNYYDNIPNLPTAIVALVLWVVILIAIVYRSWRFKIWYLTILVVGLLSHSHPYNTNSSGNNWIHHESLWTFPLERI
jgi:hypothetical protein